MFTAGDNVIFDKILEARYTCRSFSDRVPSREDVEAVIHAGQISPFASIASREVVPFRHFFVFFKGDDRYETIHRLYKEQSLADVEHLKKERETDDYLRDNSDSLEKLWNTVGTSGVNVFPDPPCLIITAEWRGARRAERQSLAHMMENMWLKATALNMNFNIISVTESMVNNSEFCELLGLPVGMYGFHACVLGYSDKPAPTAAHCATSEIHWM